MSEAPANHSVSPSAPDSGPSVAARQAEAEAALARLAAFSEKRKHGGSFMGWVFVVVLLTLLSGVGLLAWLQLSQQDAISALSSNYSALQQQNAESTNRFALLQQSQQDLSAGVQQSLELELQSTNAALAARVTALETELAATRLRVSTIDSGGSPLAEAEVLLRFAQQRLALAGDVVTALALYREADSLLGSIDDSMVGTVRDILAREVAALSALQPVDAAGIFARINAQAARLDAFTVVAESTVADYSVTPALPASVPDAGWWSALKSALGDYFVVTRGSEAVLPQLDLETQTLLRTLVRLRLEQAKLALLRADDVLYKAALDDALVASRQWFRGGEMDAYISALTALRDTPVAPAIPQTGDTLAALRLLSGASPAAAEQR